MNTGFSEKVPSKFLKNHGQLFCTNFTHGNTFTLLGFDFRSPPCQAVPPSFSTTKSELQVLVQDHGQMLFCSESPVLVLEAACAKECPADNILVGCIF